MFGAVLATGEGPTAAAILRAVGMSVPLTAAPGSLPRRVGRGPMVVTSTPDQVAEAKAFTARVKAGEIDVTKDRARSRSTVFSLQQFRVHPDSGEVTWTQEQADGLIADLVAAGVLESYAYIWQDSDLDEHGQPVPLHMHMVIKLKPGSEKSIRWIADHAHIPSSRVGTPKEWALANGGTVEVGPKAAARAFWDFAAYLTHESTSIYPAGSNDRDTGTPPQPIKPPMPFKYLYPRDEVVADFDFDALMRAGRPTVAQASKGGRAASSMTARKQALRRLVGQDGVPLLDVRAMDYDAYAEDLPRLQRLHADWLDMPDNQPSVGEGGTHRKASVLFEGPSRAGKEVLARSLSRRLVGLAAEAGKSWAIVEPSGEHSTEDVGRAEVAHHEDARWTFTRTYDDALRYIDPNQAPKQAGRNANRPASAPRLIAITTSETLLSFGLSLKARKDVIELAKSKGDFGAVNIDEFLLRLGWHVSVVQPAVLALDDLEGTKREMIVSLSRVGRVPDFRNERAYDRDGVEVGEIRTQHVLELVAVIRGCDRAAGFLAMSIMEEYSPDVAEAISTTVEAFRPEREAIAQASIVLSDALGREHEAKIMREVSATQSPEIAEHFREAHLEGRATRIPEYLHSHLNPDGAVNHRWCAYVSPEDRIAGLATRGIVITGPVRALTAA